ncbi:MAG: CotH kinase family protein, partial [Chlorobi bacterium]|nr:CotH kinase family protein [Chlorobiota bacterium]
MNFKAFALIILFLCNMPLLRADIVISEFSASCSEVVFDNDFDSPDWIELFNSSDIDINIQNYRISDLYDYDKAFVLPDTLIKARSSIILFASSKTGTDTSFIINSANNNYADDPDGTRYFRYLPVQGDFDIELCLRGMKDDAYKSYAGLLLTDDPDNGESISLIKYGEKYGYCEYNKIEDNEFIFSGRNELSIPLPDFHLRMKKSGNTVQMYYAEGGSLWTEFATSETNSSADVMYVGITVAANNYDKSASFIFKDFKLNSEPVDLSQLIINEDAADLENQFYVSEEIHCDFKLSSAGESIYLWNDKAELTDSVQFGKQRSDISFGRFPEISDNWQYMKPPTPGDNNQSGYTGIATVPEFSLPAGFYTSSVSINIKSEDEDTEIRCTVDGSPVNENSKLYNNETIQTDKNITIRARAYKDGLLPSDEVSHTYIFNESSELPIFAISVDPDEIWNDETGIFIPHNLNFKREIPAHIDYWDHRNSKLIISKNVGLKLSGQVSLVFPQKSLRLLCKSKYSTGDFEHDFFGQSGFDKYDQLLLRNGGNDWKFAFIRDSYAGDLIRKIPSLDVPEYRPSIAYLNGEYLGVYQLKERMNEDWLARRYDISPESINLMAEKTRLISGRATPFAEVYGRIVNADL